MLKARGFSLIELAVTLVVLALLVGMGVPAWQEHVANSRVRALAGDIREGMQLARMEAIRRNDRVSFCLAGQDWSVRSGADCSGGSALRTQHSAQRGVNVAPASLGVIYDGRGRTRSASGAEQTGTAFSQIALRRSGSCGAECLAMTVEYSPGGMIRVCNPALPAGDPQACGTGT